MHKNLKSTPASKHPQLGDADGVKSAFNIIILQEIATTLGYEKDVYSRPSFQKPVFINGKLSFI